MPITNIIDCRDECCNTTVSVIIEPSFQDNGVKGATQYKEVELDWIVRELGTMTVGETIALLQNEPAEITVYLYTSTKRPNQGASK